MKKIGTTEEGKVLVEFSMEEFYLFSRLAWALEGKTINEIMLRRDYGVVFPDFSGTFGAIEAFAMAKFKVNDLKELVNIFERKLDEPQ